MVYVSLSCITDVRSLFIAGTSQQVSTFTDPPAESTSNLLSSDQIRALMDKPTNIRNMSVIAHGGSIALIGHLV